MRNRMCLKILTVFILVALASGQSSGQETRLEYAADPVTMHTRTVVDIESYIFHNNSQFYAFRPGFFYGLKNERHTFGMSIPLVHTVFNGDYAGFENTTGIGDLKMSYLFVPYSRLNTIGLARVSLSMDVTAPTGEYRLGRGAGVWLYKPGVIVTLQAGHSLSFYPEMRFQFSGNDANSQGGSDGVPDPDDPEKDYKMQNLSVSFPMVALLEEWQGWFSLDLLYTRSLSEKTNFFFVRTDLGKMISPNASAALRISKFIAGQPRLNVVVQANFIFFMR